MSRELVRSVLIARRHPRIRIPGAAVRQMVAILDEGFRVLPADLPHLLPNARARARAQLATKNERCPSVLPSGELSLVFLTDAALAELHGSFLGDPSLTDVITFEADVLAGTAGEVCVSVDTAARYAREAGRDFAEELSLYLVHGLLHLAGYDDLAPARKRRMRLAERRALQLLRQQAAIPAFQATSRPRR
jgi:probable rRNA maturation factor